MSSHLILDPRNLVINASSVGDRLLFFLAGWVFRCSGGRFCGISDIVRKLMAKLLSRKS